MPTYLATDDLSADTTADLLRLWHLYQAVINLAYEITVKLSVDGEVTLSKSTGTLEIVD